MARVTVEDCLQAVGNHFALAVLAAQRARALAKGAIPLVECDNKPGVTALREIADGKVTFNESLREVLLEHVASTKALDGLRKRRRVQHGIAVNTQAERATSAKK
jgi:DNA-directed RNA polymerase subunit omega